MYTQQARFLNKFLKVGFFGTGIFRVVLVLPRHRDVIPIFNVSRTIEEVGVLGSKLGLFLPQKGMAVLLVSLTALSSICTGCSLYYIVSWISSASVGTC